VRQHRTGTLIPNLPRGEDPVHTISSPTLGLAELGERCTCGRPDIVVFLGGQHDDTDYCAPSNRMDCAWCDQPRHESRCPAYRLRPEVAL